MEITKEHLRKIDEIILEHETRARRKALSVCDAYLAKMREGMAGNEICPKCGKYYAIAADHMGNHVCEVVITEAELIASVKENVIKNMMITYSDGPVDEFGGFTREVQEQVYASCLVCEEPQLIELRYEEGKRPIMWMRPTCMQCQEKEMEGNSEFNKMMARTLEMQESNQQADMLSKGPMDMNPIKVDQPDEPMRGQITHQLHEMDLKIKLLWEINGELGKQLEPVSAPPDGTVKEGLERVPLVPVAERLAGFNMALDAFADSFMSMLTRLEL